MVRCSTWLVIFSNITERKRLELSLAAERNYFAQAIEGARLCSWDWNLQAKTVRVNSHYLRLLGHEELEQELTEEAWLAFVHPDDQARRQQILQLHIAGMQPFYEDVYRVCTASGELRYVSDRGQVISKDEFGHPLQMSGIISDITRHKEAEIAAQEAAALKSQMLTEVSHEIRTPLHGILGLASLLEQQVENPKHEALLGTIRETGDYLLRTLNEVLETARAENMDVALPSSQIESKKSDFSALAQQLQHLFYASVKEKGLQFICEVSESVPKHLRFEREKLLQVLINLIDNSIKYTEQGEIRVRFHWQSLEADAGTLVVEVQDTGIGIQNVEKVWELFVRENHQNERSSGVGLSVVENLVALLNGKIEVESTPGKGTRVVLSIPFEAGRDKAILIVDDSDVNQLVLGEMLTALNYRFITASNGEDALKVLESTPVDLVFMDLLMAGMSGIDTTRAIRKQYGGALPIVGLTANPRTFASEEAMSAGMNELISKPFTLQEIEKILNIHLGAGVTQRAET